MSIALAVALFSGVFAIMGWGPLLSEVGATVMYPFQWVTGKIGGAWHGFRLYFQDMDELRAEAESLRAENEALKDALLDAEIVLDENEWLYQYLSMKQEHSDYSLCAATVTASSTASGVGGDYVTGITLNKGTASGIKTGMPVITERGLLGVVVETGPYHCRVTTLLDPSASVGAVTSRSGEHGLCMGDYARVHDGMATLRHLPEEADVQTGDIVLTGGHGSVYPYGIPIGRVESVSNNALSRTTEASILPFADFEHLTHVLIMTDYVHHTDGCESAEEDGGGT